MENLKIFFNDLIKSENKEALEKLFDKHNIKRKDKNTYPDLEINISLEEIKILKEKSIITNENDLNTSLAKNTDLTPLEKLLYAVIWKNGDLIKIKHIISGIYGKSTTGKVFNQFGRHLRNKDEPIIDQHVLRAYIYYISDEIIKDINNKHFDQYANSYKEWINQNKVLKMNMNLTDELLFGVGRMLKLKKTQ